MFEVFLPQLLLYPNPSDPLNGEAAALMMRDRAAYEQRVKGIDPFQSFCFPPGFALYCLYAWTKIGKVALCLSNYFFFLPSWYFCHFF